MKMPENLPPLKIYKTLVLKENEQLMTQYLTWIKLLALRGLHLKKTSEKSFNILYRAVSRHWQKRLLLGRLQEEFIKENLSLSLLLEPLDGFEWLSKNRYPLNFSASSPIMLQIVMPFARLIAALNHQHPPFYQPFANLISAYIGLYMLSIKDVENLFANTLITLDKTKIAGDLLLLHQEAKQVLPVIRGIKFKLKIAFYLGLCKVLILKIMKKNLKKINFVDYVNAFLYSLWYSISIKGKEIKLRKI